MCPVNADPEMALSRFSILIMRVMGILIHGKIDIDGSLPAGFENARIRTEENLAPMQQ